MSLTGVDLYDVTLYTHHGGVHVCDVGFSCSQGGTCAGASGALVSGGQRRRTAADDQDLLRLDAMQPSSDRHLRQGDVQLRVSFPQVSLLFKTKAIFPELTVLVVATVNPAQLSAT